MCGIYASISTHGPRQPSEAAKRLLCNRGPDHIGELHTDISSENGKTWYISLVSTVLALRGGHVTNQPFQDDHSGSSLCWNGEAWKIGLDAVTGNDGQAVFESLLSTSSAQVTSKSSDDVLRVLRGIVGPFAFVFLDRINDQIYFGRDRLGRRSLLYKNDGDATSLEFSSVADPATGPWTEVEADAIYQLSYDNSLSVLHQHESKLEFSLKSIAPISMHRWNGNNSDALPISLGTFNKAIPDRSFTLELSSESVVRLNRHLSESLKLRILNIPLPPNYQDEHQVRVAVLFSGGLDCTVLARMAHDILPSDQYIDLLNVAFENPRVIQAAKNATTPRKCSGKDTAIFLKLPEKITQLDDTTPYENCPDRETGRKAFQELQKVCPGRSWRFVAIDIPYTETIAHRASVVDLIHPHNTEMDLSIAYALYFAARGTGQATTNFDHTPVQYTTQARVLLSGLGADELFGGYTRHATAFNRNGYSGLLDELKLDVDRLGKRNLGRDDRIISNWGREARFPYLDEALVKWAVECPIWEKCDFQLGDREERQVLDIEPGKKVLRLLAYQLGMHLVASEKKRAIQFGARTAKMEVGRTKGTNLIS